MRKKALSIVLSVVLASSFLTGCGSEFNASASLPAEEVREVTVTHNAQTASPKASSSDDTKNNGDAATPKRGETEVPVKTPQTAREAAENMASLIPNTSNLLMGEGSTEKITVDTNGAAVDWHSTNPSVASVDANGNVTANKAGEADIIVSNGNTQSTTHITVDTEECDHAYGEGTVEVAAGCETDGYMLYICTECGSDYRVKIPATGHNLLVETVMPTCTEDGYRVATCLTCGVRETLDIYPATSHNYSAISIEPPTCTTGGKIFEACSCGATRTTETEANGHSWSSWTVDVEATTEREGQRSRSCTVCGFTETESTPKHIHSYNGVRTNPTCTEEGRVIYSCSCGDSYTETVPATGHKCNWEITTEPLCTVKGEESLICNVCGEVVDTREVDAKGHGELLWSIVKQPTCTEAGLEQHTCKDCGATIESRPVASTGHIPGVWVGSVAATCGTPGKEELHCKSCDEVLSTRDVPATGHNYKSEVTNATCTTSGITVFTCINCGDTYEDITPATGHKAGNFVISKQPACTEKGLKTQSCITCGEILATEEIPANGHSESGWITDTQPDCTNEGHRHTECNVCHVVINADSIPKTSHTEGSWNVSKEPTCTEKGIKTQNCITCGTILATEEIPATGHTPGEWKGTSSATCGAPGTEEKRCQVCDVVIETREVSAMGHDYEAVTTSATCTTGGKTVYTCKRCGDTYEDNLTPATGHNTGDWVVDTEAGCETNGSRHKSCLVCGTVIVTETIPAAGHDWIINTVPATCQTEGYTQKECATCHKVTDKVSTGLGEHTPGAWNITVETGCFTEGQRSRSCEVCGKVLETETIPADGNHDWQVKKVVAPLPCRNGSTTYFCTRCGLLETRDIVPGGGKSCDFDWDSRRDNGDGTYRVKCTVCGMSETITESEYNEIIQTNGQVAAKISEVIAQVIKDGMTDAEKIIAINNWLCRNVVYDDETFQQVLNGQTPDSYRSFESAGALIDGLAVCGGYAYAFKDFMDELGIECLYVSSESMNHAWNQVKLEDGWYWIDPTWNDTGNDADFYDRYLFKTGKRAEDEVGGVECDGEIYQGGKTVYDKYGVESKEDIPNIYNEYAEDEMFYISYDFASNWNLMDKLNEEYEAKYGETLSYTTSVIDGREIACIKNSDNVRDFFSEQAVNGIMVMSAVEAMSVMSMVPVEIENAEVPVENLDNVDMGTVSGGDAVVTTEISSTDSIEEAVYMEDTKESDDTMQSNGMSTVSSGNAEESEDTDGDSHSDNEKGATTGMVEAEVKKETD